jgi:hypothetical protein
MPTLQTVWESLWPAHAASMAAALAAVLAAVSVLAAAPSGGSFDGKFYRGQGDVEYLELLDISRRMFDADPEFQNVAMLYTPAWNGFVEGPTWNAWWIQNSYGPTYCAMPFYGEPYWTFLQNADDLWFRFIGDGKPYTSPFGGHKYTPPDGQLCDAANTQGALHMQGDGRVNIHDFGLEFTAAGLLMQAEALLISRDAKAVARYLPLLERCANLIETRRDPKNNLFLAGPAANLLAPSYAGWKRPDGTFDRAYLAGLSITYIAALDRLIEVEKLAGNAEKAGLYSARRDLARRGLPALATDEGYFVKSVDPDGTRHGVFGAPRFGYFEAVCNHDAICFRVVDDAQAARIYAKIASIPGLRRHDLITTNEPSLDDMYEPPTSWLWEHGRWVNGGHWTTCEARMVMAYFRLGKFDDARRAMRQLMKFARAFRMDNPLVNFGNAVYQPGEAVNLCYDSFGLPAAMMRGLMEYIYRADGLTLLPHVPPGITRLEQHFPVRFGAKRLYLAVTGSGPVTAVLVNGRPWKLFDAASIRLPYDETPAEAVIQIALGGAAHAPFAPRKADAALPVLPPPDDKAWVGPDTPVIVPNRLPLRIGADSHAGSRFLGDIAQPHVFSRALAAEEVAALAAGKAGDLDKDPALVGSWDLGNRKGDLFASLAADGPPAKAVGNVTVVDAPTGKAVRLTGAGYLEVAHGPKVDLTRECTLEAWVCPKALPPGGARIIDKTEVGTSTGYLLDTWPGNSLRLICERGVLSHDARLAPDKWAHVAATIAADGRLALYVNGKVVASEKKDPALAAAAACQAASRMRRLYARLRDAGLADCYEAAHARLAVGLLDAYRRRMGLLADGTLKPLPPASQIAADKSYLNAVTGLCDGLAKTIAAYKDSEDPHRKTVYRLWGQE